MQQRWLRRFLFYIRTYSILFGFHLVPFLKNNLPCLAAVVVEFSFQLPFR